MPQKIATLRRGASASPKRRETGSRGINAIRAMNHSVAAAALAPAAAPLLDAYRNLGRRIVLGRRDLDVDTATTLVLSGVDGRLQFVSSARGRRRRILALLA